MTDKSDKFTPTEETLVSVLAFNAASRTGTLTRQAGVALTPEQAMQLSELQLRALVEFVRGLRSAEETPSPEALDELIQGIAARSLLQVVPQARRSRS